VVGKLRGSTVSDVFVTTAPGQAFPPSDVLGWSLHRGALETVLGDEDQEQDTERWMSHSAGGHAFWHIVTPWVWKSRWERGHHLAPSEMRLTEFAPAPVGEPAPAHGLRNEMPRVIDSAPLTRFMVSHGSGTQSE